MHFTKKLKAVLREKKSHLCIGLDTDIRQVPLFLRNAVNPVFEFNKLIIDSTKDLVCSYKINIAFYERLGELWWTTIKATLKAIPVDLITIADAKRGDIENTSEIYAQTYFDELGFDSITVQPYMGADSVRPFIRRKNKFVFLLALTSNYGANDFQFLKIGKKRMYEIVIDKALDWNSQKIGFVVGANHPKELKSITIAYPDVPILIPGIGVQKNSLKNVVSSLHHNQFIINQSRSIIYSAPNAQNATEFSDTIRKNALSAKEEIDRLLESEQNK